MDGNRGDTDHQIPQGFDAALEMLKALIASRKLVKDRLDENPIRATFEIIGKAAKEGTDRDRLEAISVLGKAAEISKPLADLAQPLLKSALRIPIPGTGIWGAADDRYYLAKAVSVSDEIWVADYAAVELARADVAEKKSREVWAEIAIHRSKDLASALKTIERAFAEDRRDSDYSVDTACRKLNRVLGALGNPLSLADLPLGAGFGQSFSDLILRGGGIRGPEARALRDETALAVLELMVQLLRLRFSAAVEADTYRAVGTVLGWWKPARPSDRVNHTADRILAIAMDALHVLARQGVSERVVRQSLVNAFGQEKTSEFGRAIAQADPSLEPNISNWLATGKDIVSAQSNDAVRDINEQALDEVLANLLIAVARQDSIPNTLDMMAGEMEILEPGHATTLKTAAGRIRLVTQWAGVAATKRRLRLYGELGELVAYDPAVHVTDNAFQISARGRIQVPGVIKEPEGMPAKIIVKAQVEKVEGDK